MTAALQMLDNPLGPEEEGFQIVQDGLIVAEAYGPGAWREILWYAFQYAEDGKVTIQCAPKAESPPNPKTERASL